jgi:hypothetical protein
MTPVVREAHQRSGSVVAIKSFLRRHLRGAACLLFASVEECQNLSRGAEFFSRKFRSYFLFDLGPRFYCDKY